MDIRKIEGLVAAPFTPMLANGEINYDIIEQYYDFLVKNGIIGIFLNGSTGEGVSISQKEKMLLIEKWGKVSKRGNLKIINLVGGNSYKDCIELAKASSDAGIYGISVMAPFYFKPVNVNKLAEYVSIIGESVPDLPVYFYHIPFLSGVNLPMISFLEAIKPMLPNFAGIKYTHEDLMDYLTCLNFDNGHYDMLWGKDENFLSALVLGMKGAVGSTYNYAAPLYHKLTEAYNTGDLCLARKFQKKVIDMISLLDKYGGIGTGKAYMRYIGMDCGEFRPPVTNLNSSDYELFVKDVKALEMEEYFSRT